MCRIKTRIQNILQNVKEKLPIQTKEKIYRQYISLTRRKHTKYFTYQKTNHILTLFHVSS